jgi:hypothetical protein
MDVGNVISLLSLPKLPIKSNDLGGDELSIKQTEINSLIFRPATDEERISQLASYHSIWGKDFTLEEYVSADTLLGSMPFSVNRKCFVLASSTQILASCEYYTRPCALKISGIEVSGFCWAIEIVYTGTLKY